MNDDHGVPGWRTGRQRSRRCIRALPFVHLKNARIADIQEPYPMNTLSLAAVALSALLLLPACGDDDHDEPRATSTRFDHGDGAIGMKDDKVVIEAGGQKHKAIVAADGSLMIGDTLIDTSSDGQAALKAYDAAAVAMKTHAIAIGRTGAEFGVDVLKDVVRGFFGDEGMDKVGERAQAGALDLVANLRDLCTRLETVLSTQQAAAAAVPAFQPYAVLEAEQVRECFEEIDEEAEERKPPAVPDASAPVAPSAT